ncbi:MAG: bifunctional aspartate kinase/homoserine dehydrogenase I [Proteobacteria bacterium]|nr:MAG: bifunctional aspartate kinase/homoserine dehydrogenase I [Pseudomonadota bacterium]
MKPRVFKFGGTSLATPDSLLKVIAIIRSHASGLCVVVSASSGVTDSLYKIYYGSLRGETGENVALLSALEDRHIQLVRGVIAAGPKREALETHIRTMVDELRRIADSLAILREDTPRALSRAVSYGERLMAAIVTETLNDKGSSAALIDSTHLIKMNRDRQEYAPDDARSKAAVKAELVPALAAGKIVIVPGFFGEGPEGEVMILGRGGSDYSATLLGSYLEAQEVCLYKEVDGLMTADPRHVFEARVLSELHYREAAELAYYGAKVLHPRAIIPLVAKRIPLIVKSTFFPDKPGTRIDGNVVESSFPVKALSYIDKQALIAVEGKGMMGVPGIASKAFGAMALHGISTSFITQASSEASISFVVPGEQGAEAKRALEEAFQFEIEHQLIDEVKLQPHIAVLAVVGLGMRGTPGIAARAFSCIARQEISIMAIAQGSSELNISLVIEQDNAARALRALHKEYGLEKLRAIPHRNPRELNVAIHGFGQIGQTLMRQLQEQKDYLENRLKLRCPIVGLSDRSGLVVAEKGFTEQEQKDYLKAKSSKQKLRNEKSPVLDEAQMDQLLWHGPWDRRIFIDLTASDSAPMIRKALQNGFHVVLANKKPLAIPYVEYKELLALAASNGVQLRYEATVGAGLPVLDTIDKLTIAGDQVQEILGCFSGTLGYLMTELEDGTLFSVAVRQAFEKGYTEPDPRDDLSGMDVARKALILARSMGIAIEIEDIKLDPLFPQSVSHDDPQVFMENLKALDAEYTKRMRAAKEKSSTLRYVARISKDKVSVGVEEISKSDALGRLRGTDNQVSIKTTRYHSNPLIVTGPGAGAEVTAAGVLNDIITIATSQVQELRS